ncbi:MAG: hypothetical protein QOK48_1871 [Blastocatellia bacterium]|nr:hypothetical protein [Blastocatellia bacterium]
MFCPQCGTESSADLHYCRSCGANLKVIGKAVSLSEAINRTDGVPAKIKDMIKNLKVEKVTEEVSRALERMNKEIVRSAHEARPAKPAWLAAKQKTAAQRRERHLTKGMIKFFWGGGLTIFLYALANALVLKLPPDVIAKIPFEVGPVVHVIWLLGLIPMLSGVGHVLAGLSVRPDPPKELESPDLQPLRIDPANDGSQYAAEMAVATPRPAPFSVTERTTNILDRDPSRPTEEI